MDGELDIDNRDIKGAIDDVLAEDVFWWYNSFNFVTL